MKQAIMKNVLRLCLQTQSLEKIEKLNENLYGSVQQTDI